MPSAIAPEATISSSSAALSLWISVAGSPASARMPSTSVRNTSFSDAKGLGDRPRHGVRVDVVGLPGAVRADRGDYGHEPLGQKAVHDRRIDRLDVADISELGVTGSRGDEPGVLPDSPIASGP